MKAGLFILELRRWFCSENPAVKSRRAAAAYDNSLEQHKIWVERGCESLWFVILVRCRRGIIVNAQIPSAIIWDWNRFWLIGRRDLGTVSSSAYRRLSIPVERRPQVEIVRHEIAFLWCFWRVSVLPKAFGHTRSHNWLYSSRSSKDVY